MEAPRIRDLEKLNIKLLAQLVEQETELERLRAFGRGRLPKKELPRTRVPLYFEEVDVSIWQNMAGDYPLEKMINSYLAGRFALSSAPADECLSEAKDILKIISSYTKTDS